MRNIAQAASTSQRLAQDPPPSQPRVFAIWERIPKWALQPMPGLSRHARLTLIDLHGLKLQNGRWRGSVGGKGWTIPRLARRIGRATRSFQRDLSALYRYGCDCTAHSERPRSHQGLVVRSGRYLTLSELPAGAYAKTAPLYRAAGAPWSEARASTGAARRGNSTPKKTAPLSAGSGQHRGIVISGFIDPDRKTSAKREQRAQALASLLDKQLAPVRELLKIGTIGLKMPRDPDTPRSDSWYDNRLLALRSQAATLLGGSE